MIRDVQTFLPFASFKRSARVLDRARLGRQRTEVVQLLRAITSHEPVGYQNHPAAKMWRGKDAALASYGLHICAEWTRRGYSDEQGDIMADFFPFVKREQLMMSPVRMRELGLLPWWFGWRKFHASHRSNLMRKDVDHYEWRFAEHGLEIAPDFPYVWPAQEWRVWKEQHSRDSPYYVKLPGYHSSAPSRRG